MTIPSFADYLAKYPIIHMPVTLGEETHHAFGTENDPLSDILIDTYIVPLEQEQPDEFTEYIPCFQIADTVGFTAIVYWKAALLNYEYALVTYTPKGAFINRKVIARTRVEGERIVRTVATIDDELVVFIAEGAAVGGIVEDFDPTSSKTYNMEILANGEIVQYNLAMN